MGKLISKGHPCIFEGCGSSDALAIYDDKVYCFSCNRFKKSEDPESLLDDVVPVASKQKHTAKGATDLTDRKIKKETLKTYGVKAEVSEGKIIKHHYPYHSVSGEHLGTKTRFVEDKDFMWSGDSKNTSLFGLHLFPPASAEYVTVTEGELDALSGYQMSGSKFPWVSVKSASEAEKNCKSESAYKFLSSFKHIVLCFDNDTAGKQAAEKVAKLFPAGKVLVCKHLDGFKDASDYLQQGKEQDFMKRVWWKAAEWRPEGIVRSNEMRERLKDFKYVKGIDYPFKSWNERTLGIRPSEFVLLAARRASGKTTTMRQIAANVIREDPEAKVGAFFLEETVERAFLGIMSIEIEKPLHHPDVEYTEDEWQKAWDSCMEEGRINLYDQHDGKISLDKLEEYIRFYVKALGCQYIIVDHLGLIRVPAFARDERKAMDEVAIMLSALAVELNVSIIGSIHINREGKVRGSDGPENSASVVIEMAREQGKDADIEDIARTDVWVTKNRLYGELSGRCNSLQMSQNGVTLEEPDDFVKENAEKVMVALANYE